MSDFTVKIDSTLNLRKAKSQMNEFLSKYKGEVLKIGVELNIKELDTGQLGKQLQSSVGNIGTNAGKTFAKNIESTISRVNIDQLVNRLNSKNISKDIISGAEKNLNNLAKTGIQINKIAEQFSDKNGLISLKIDGIDEGERAVTILSKLNLKTKEWETKTTYVDTFKNISDEANKTSQKLLTLDEIKTRLFQAQGKTGSLEAQFGNVDKFSQDFNELGVAIHNALSEVDNGGDVSKLSSTLADIEGRVKTLTSSTKEWHKVNQTDTEIQSSARKQLEEAEKYINKQKELQSALDALKKQSVTLIDPNSENYSSSIVSEFDEVEKAVNNITSKSTATVASNMFSGLKASVKNASSEIKTEVTNIAQDIDRFQSKFKESQSRLSSFQSKDISKYKDTAAYAQIENNLKRIDELQKSISSQEALGDSADIGKMNSDLKEMNSLLSKSETAYNNLTKPLGTFEAMTASNKTLSWIKNNTKASKELGDAFDLLAEKQKRATTSGELEQYNKEFKQLVSYAQSKGLTGKSPFEEFKRAGSQIAQFTGVYGVLQQIPQALSKMASAVIEVDTAMTNLYKVTDETDAKYTEFLTNAGNTAKTLGRDVSSYIEQTANWAKLGYTMDQSAELAKTSSIYANVGEVDDNTAVSDLVTVMKAYDITADDALSIVNKYNKLGNEFATSAKDLGEGMSNAASMLALGGTDVNKALALLTGGSEITQSAGELGNALKIGQMRIQGMKGDLEALGEESEGLESVSKIQTHILNLTKGQVNIMDSADPSKFRDYYDILEDVSEVWNTMEQTEQADLLETMFGKNRGNQGAAIIQAFQSGQIQKAYQATLNAQGSAQAEQDRWLQSAEADFCLVA